jgi:hypothetical protein
MWKTLATFGLVIGVTTASAVAVTTHVDRSSFGANPETMIASELGTMSRRTLKRTCGDAAPRDLTRSPARPR